MTNTVSSREIKYALLEIFVGLGLALIFNYYYSAEIGALIFGVSVMFAISRTLIFRWYVLEFSTISDSYKLKEKIKEIKDKEFLCEAVTAEEAFIDYLQLIASGTIKYETIGNYLIAAEAQIQNTDNEMRAVAFIRPEEWIEGGELKNYFDKQAIAIKKRGLNVARIFFFSKDELENEIVKQVLDTQESAGVDIYIADKDKVKDVTRPFVIYDDKVAIVGELNDLGKIVKGEKTIDRVKIKNLIRLFEHTKSVNSYKYKKTK